MIFAASMGPMPKTSVRAVPEASTSASMRSFRFAIFRCSALMSQDLRSPKPTAGGDGLRRPGAVCRAVERPFLTDSTILLPEVQRVCTHASPRYPAHHHRNLLSEVRAGPLWVASLAVLSNPSGKAGQKGGQERACQQREIRPLCVGILVSLTKATSTFSMSC